MAFSRRGFLRALGTGMAMSAVPAMPTLSNAIPFEPARSRRPGSPILLNSNENAYGPSRPVRETLQRALANSSRYPVSNDALVARLAELHHVSPESLLVGCGSTEMLRVLAAGLLGPGKMVITASPTFEAISEYANQLGGQTVAVPLDHQYSHDLDAMLAKVNGTTALVYICNPNNPTGSITPRKSIDSFVAKLPPEVVVVVDEAYHHFALRSSMYVSFLDQTLDDKRVVVLRTFSKAFGLAGLRVGYAVASPDLTARFRPYVTDTGISELGLQAALAALDDEAGLRLAVKRNADDRQEFFNQSMARMLKPIDSKTNFVMMDTRHPAAEAIEHFRANNVMVGRLFPAMNTCIRVSLGTPTEMIEFWRVWDMLPYSHGMKM